MHPAEHLSHIAGRLLVALVSATILRAATWSRDPSARQEDAVARQARAFTFVPEAMLGWATLGKQCAVSVLELEGHALLVGSVPSPTLIHSSNLAGQPL